MGWKDLLPSRRRREADTQFERVRQHRELREREDARVAAGERLHFVLSHDWGDERHYGAHMIAHSVGEPVIPQREQTPVIVDFFARFNPGTSVTEQIEKVRQRLVLLRHDYPKAVLHYACDLGGFGTPGFDYLLRSDAFSVNVIYAAVQLTNQGEDHRDPLRAYAWRRGKQKLIYGAATAMPVVSLPPAQANAALAQLPQQLRDYRFGATEKQAIGLQALRDTANDDLVITFALSVYKLQTRGKTTERYGMGFLSRARALQDNDGLQPLMPSFVLK